MPVTFFLSAPPFSPCLSIQGPPCLFPFIYQGVRYEACHTLGDENPWCAIERDEQDNLVELGQCMLDDGMGGGCPRHMIEQGGFYST